MSKKEEQKKVHPLQRAWAAGIFDAKGYIHHNGSRLQMCSTDEPMMKRFYETVGIGSLWADDKKNCSHLQWRWQSNTLEGSHDFIKLVSPFLSARKLKTAGAMLARIERNPYWQKKNKKKVISSDTDPAD